MGLKKSWKTLVLGRRRMVFSRNENKNNFAEKSAEVLLTAPYPHLRPPLPLSSLPTYPNPHLPFSSALIVFNKKVAPHLRFFHEGVESRGKGRLAI